MIMSKPTLSTLNFEFEVASNVVPNYCRQARHRVQGTDELGRVDSRVLRRLFVPAVISLRVEYTTTVAQLLLLQAWR